MKKHVYIIAGDTRGEEVLAVFRHLSEAKAFAYTFVSQRDKHAKTVYEGVDDTRSQWTYRKGACEAKVICAEVL